jgi:Homocysteine/selenocysteine methylase (S-methylmethionine-dependent)
MDKNYFKKIKILDGGMGQQLLSKGLISKGTLWSASALLEEKYHQLIIDAHLSFIDAGAEIILTNTFTTRKVRFQQNNVNDKFEYANKKACELALKAKEISKKNILIAGALPAQNDTYKVDERNELEIKKSFEDQANLIEPYIDFFYLDVLSSIKEIKVAIEVLNNFNKPILIGVHIKKNGKLPSGERISEIFKSINIKKVIGILTACVSIKRTQKTSLKFKKLDITFGFKFNLWGGEEPLSIKGLLTPFIPNLN